jgi:hypothetical protein
MTKAVQYGDGVSNFKFWQETMVLMKAVCCVAFSIQQNIQYDFCFYFHSTAYLFLQNLIF